MSNIEAFCSKDYTKKQGGMNLPEIKAELKKRGLNTTGNRSVLREILCGKHKQHKQSQEPQPQEPKQKQKSVEADLREKITRLTAACSGKSLRDGGYNVAQLAAIAVKLKAPKTVRLREDYEAFLKPHIVDLQAELKALLSRRRSTSLNYNTLEGGFSLNQSRFGTTYGITLSMDIYLNDNTKPTVILDEKIPLLETIRTSHIPALMSIVSDPTVMPDGKTWTPSKLTEFVKQGESDWLNRDIDPISNQNVENNAVGRRYDWTILSTDRTPVGVLSLFSRDNSKNYEIVLFIAASEQGNGLGTIVIKALLFYINEHLYNRDILAGPVGARERTRYSLIESLTGHTNENVAGESILRKTGFTFKENSVVDKKPVKVFTYDFSTFDKKRTEMEAMFRKREAEIKAMFKEREKLQEEQERRSSEQPRRERERSPSRRHRERERSPPRHRERERSPPRHRERERSPPRHRERDRMFREREKLQEQERERRSREHARRRERDRSPPRVRDQKSAKLSFYSGFVKGTTIDATYPSK
jgi:hypothetical protein